MSQAPFTRHPDTDARHPIVDRLHEIIFEAETPAGKLFDVVLLIVILASVAAVMLETVADIRARWGPTLLAVEWTVTILFTIEYVLRLIAVRRSLKYAFSFFGIVDLLAILPTYISVLIPGTQSLLVIRVLRLLRVFRVFKLAHFVGEARELRVAMAASRAKITVFLVMVVTIVTIIGSLMHLAEGQTNPDFDNVPKAMYWAVVTLTTVGYGDLAPDTTVGRFMASCLMLLGYAIIAVPTGIVTAEIAFAKQQRRISTHACPNCSAEDHDPRAMFCKFCGAVLHPEVAK